MRVVEVRREDGSLLCQAELANGFLSRAKGLLGRKRLDPHRGMLLEPCTSVHMMFMRFAIDVLYLDQEDRIVKAVNILKPFRFSRGGKRAMRAIELEPGTIEEMHLSRYERLTVAR